jgi:hypothetical protein
MKLLSSRLILGSVASLAMASAASAADLPMKAKAPAVQYVKICSLYGAGFYYIPGTDTCLKIGGHLRVDLYLGPSGGPAESVDYNRNYDLAATRYFNTRVRAYATFDARAQTAYGTLRSYFLTGATYNANGDGNTGAAVTPYMIRAFIQLAGFTWGLTTSIFDAYSITPIHMNYVVATNGSVGATGIWQWRYTAQFGNGFSASISIEEPRTRIKPIYTFGGAAQTHVGASWPDILASLNASGSWGRAQVAFAVKDASIVTAPGATTSLNKIGWAAMIGGLLRIPGLPGDTFGFQFTYAEGATDYVAGNANASAATGAFALVKDGTTSTGLVADGTAIGGVYELAKAWGFEAGYEHHWTKTLKTSLAGGYVALEYSNSLLGGGIPGLDTSYWNVGSRTQWNVVPNFSLAVDVLYTHIDGATGFATVAASTSDADIWTGMVRVRRDFWP